MNSHFCLRFTVDRLSRAAWRLVWAYGCSGLLLALASGLGAQGKAVAATGAITPDATVPEGSTSGAWTLLHAGDFDWQQRADRLQVADDLRRRVQSLRQHVPEQSPAELASVAQREAKLGGSQAQARSRLYLSLEFQHRELSRMLVQIDVALACVQERAAIAAEMACWADVAVALLKEGQLRLALDTLRRHGRLPRTRDTPVIHRDPDLWYAHFGRGILESILAPYLRAEQEGASVELRG